MGNCAAKLIIICKSKCREKQKSTDIIGFPKMSAPKIFPVRIILHLCLSLVDMLFAQKRAESPTLYSPIRKGWVSRYINKSNTLAHNPKGCAVAFALVFFVGAAFITLGFFLLSSFDASSLFLRCFSAICPLSNGEVAKSQQSSIKG